MNRYTLKSILLVLLTAALPVFTSCSSTAKVEKTSTSAFKEGVPGGVLVETYETTATVTRVDHAKRTVTLLAPDGTYNTFAAGPQDAAFEKLRVDDQVKISVARELVVFLARNGPPTADGPNAASALDSNDAATEILIAKPVQRNARIAAVDPVRRLVMLQFTDGSTKSFPLRKDVKATGLNPGDEVVIQTGSAVALELMKP